MSPPNTTTRLFVAHVSHDAECDMWIAVCDVIGLTTEAKTYEALTQRVWEIIPEIARENGIDPSIEKIRIIFRQDQRA